MGRFAFDITSKNLLEQAPIPYAIYQNLKRDVVTILVSDGFCRLFGMSRREAMYLMDTDMYRDAWPDDISRIQDAAYRFTNEGADYNVIYRSKMADSDEYHIIHAKGEHITMSDGTRLAVVWYTDEGRFEEADILARNNMQTIGKDNKGLLHAALHSRIHLDTMIQESHYDRLTGLPNMTYFLRIAEEFKDEVYEEGDAPMILYFDLNGMKGFNEKYGFAAGNQLLISIARILEKQIGKGSCGHFGSDHFVACIRESTDVDHLMKNIFADVAAIDGGRTLPIRVGIYKDSFEMTDATIACDRAKVACDLEKTSYVSRYAYFDRRILNAWNQKTYIRENLDRALREGWIQVYYQPIVRGVSGLVCNEEALARWAEPGKPMVSPGEFIPILEEAGLLYKVDLRIVELIAADVERRKQGGMRNVPISVNLSWSDFQVCDMVQEICSRLDAAGVPHSLLNIEITESMMANNPDYMRIQIRRFHEAGFSVWMDDFGSGYSSLYVLEKYEFDLIKFDMQFMRNFFDSEKSRIIMTQLTQMAVKLGIDTVAEGVEKKEQVRFLREIGVDKIQGFYFSKPQNLNTILRRYQIGTGIGIEHIRETGYYDQISKAGLNEPAVNDDMDQSGFSYFSAIPMGIIEICEDQYLLMRYNKPFGDLMQKRIGSPLPDVIRRTNLSRFEPTPHCREGFARCIRSDKWELIENLIVNETKVHAFVKKLAVNPNTGATAVEMVILFIQQEAPR